MDIKRRQCLSSREIVERYLSFFCARGHQEIAGNALILPGNTTSFVIAGMQPLLPYLRGQMAPPSPRLTSLQRCLRSDDGNLVGSNGCKNSAFFMLGNWSINEYGKLDAIRMAYEFLVGELQFDPAHLWVTVFAGEPELCLLPDDLAARSWLDVGISSDHIVMLGTEDNFWTMGSGPGPCGPCTEIFVDRGTHYGCGSPTCRPGCSCERFLEIWNLVFMEYERLTHGLLTPLPMRNIDTGMGLERMAAVLQDTESVFTVDLFQPAWLRLRELEAHGISEHGESETRARRLIVDHARAVLLAGLAGVGPGRDGRNSVVRRLIRRAVRQGRIVGIERPFLGTLLHPLAEGHHGLLTKEEYQRIPLLEKILDTEERHFSGVLSNGLRYLERLQPDERGMIAGTHLFKLHAEKGFPSDLAGEILAERGLIVDWSTYEREFQTHRQISRVSASSHFRS